MLKAQCYCWAPASAADWGCSFTGYQNIGDIKEILWANLYIWLALMIFAVRYLYVALLHSKHCNAWGHYCIGFTACWFCCWANLSCIPRDVPCFRMSLLWWQRQEKSSNNKSKMPQEAKGWWLSDEFLFAPILVELDFCWLAPGEDWLICSEQEDQTK